MPEQRPDVVLAQMPFAAIERPSIGLGLLSALLRNTRISCKVIYANIEFCEQLGVERYQMFETIFAEELLGEWCFSRAAFPHFQSESETYLNAVHSLRFGAMPASHHRLERDMLREIRSLAVAFVDDAAQRVVEMRPRIVGCSSTFQQHCASLALLRRVRELDPAIVTMMGGANCEAEMGVATARSFPWVDYVVSGEAEEIFIPLCTLAMDHGREAPTRVLPHGVITSSEETHGGAEGPPRAVVVALDAVPTPDYDDYFETLAASSLGSRVIPGLPVETSRGCWWGQKHQCTFCGLNGLGIAYRMKSPPRILEELASLDRRYGVPRFEVVDNILHEAHLSGVMGRLVEQRRGWTLFYETRPNLKRGQVRVLAQAGVRWIQPGIESLHDDVLALMNKGSSTLMNVQFLKWARESGVRVAWNVLTGVPGERDAWYAEMAEWIPLIEHLQPPAGFVRVRYDRFSPYHIHPDRYGIEIRVNRSYRFVYPLPDAELAQLAYFFEDAPRHAPREDRRTDTPGRLAVRQALANWTDRFWGAPSPPMLVASDDGCTLRVLDTRQAAVQRRSSIQGLARLVHLACDDPQTAASVLARVRAADPTACTQAVQAALDDLERLRLLLRWRGKYLSLALPDRLPTLPFETEFPGGIPNAPPQAVARLRRLWKARQIALGEGPSMSSAGIAPA